MPGRTLDNGNKYRYGFNGKENDNEVKGEGNQQDYGMRIYDPRLGRFLSVDPLTKGFPWYTPYQFAGNSPIAKIDLDGEEPKDFKQNWKYQPLFELKTQTGVAGTGLDIDITDPKLNLVTARMVYDNVTEAYWIICEKDNKSYYLKNSDGNNSVMTLDPKTYTLKGGEFVEFETQNQAQARIRAESADLLGVGIFGIAAGASAAPFVAALSGGTPLLATNLSKAGLLKAIAGGGGDFLAQSTLSQEINWVSVGANAIFPNPFTAGVTSSIFTQGESGLSLATPQEFAFNAISSSVFNAAGGQILGNYSKIIPNSSIDKGVNVMANTITNFYGDVGAGISNKAVLVTVTQVL